MLQSTALVQAMSSQLISEQSEQVVLNYIVFISTTCVIYEYCVTLSSEVEFIWKHKLTTSTSIMFFLNRYNTLFCVLLASATAVVPTTNAICKFYQAVGDVSGLISFVVWAIFSGLRVYSMDRRKKALAMLAFGLGMVPFCTNLYPYIMQAVLATTSFEGQCTSPWTLPQMWTDILEPATRVSLMLGDAIVLYATLSSNYSLRSRLGSSQVKSSLCSLLVRNGTFYFASLLILNCMQLAFWITNTFQFFSDITLPISSIIISRFILDLREIYFSSTRPSFLNAQYSESNGLSTVHFTSIEAASFAVRQSGASPDSEQLVGVGQKLKSPEELQDDMIPEDEVPGVKRDDADGHCVPKEV